MYAYKVGIIKKQEKKNRQVREVKKKTKNSRICWNSKKIL
jgi:hypothetical protein